MSAYVYPDHSQSIICLRKVLLTYLLLRGTKTNLNQLQFVTNEWIKKHNADVTHIYRNEQFT